MADKNKLEAFLSTRVIDKSDTEVLTKPKPVIVKKNSLKDFLTLTNENGENITLRDIGLDEVIDKEYSNLTDNERVLLYEKAMEFKQLGNKNHALLCWLGCLKGLQPTSKSRFTMLPQCLTHIAEIYADAGDYQKAVEFMQGTKLYYETAIIETSVQVDNYKKETRDEYRPLDLDPCLDDARRANEYERLSNSCLEQRKFQLALEYCGKAVKLRQQVYGDSDSLTVKSLDLFTLIYAEMGKSQYSEAMSKYGAVAKSINEELDLKKKPKRNEETIQLTDKKSPDEKNSPVLDEEINEPLESAITGDRLNEGNNAVETPKASIPVKEPEKTKRVHFEDESPSLKEITCWQLITFLLISVLLAILLTVLWCRTTDSPACPSGNYVYTQARYWYYFYFKSAGTNSSFY